MSRASNCKSQRDALAFDRQTSPENSVWVTFAAIPPVPFCMTLPEPAAAVLRAHSAAEIAAEKINEGPVSAWFTRLASATAHAAGRPATFALCCLTILVWAVMGPVFHYSDTWQLIINTGTTIVTFLMVFLIQNTQNRDGAALQAKLDELIRATHDARNAYMGIERLPERELEHMREHFADHGQDSGALTDN
jgi:low affinity Fe/Cu permease